MRSIRKSPSAGSLTAEAGSHVSIPFSGLPPLKIPAVALGESSSIPFRKKFYGASTRIASGRGDCIARGAQPGCGPLGESQVSAVRSEASALLVSIEKLHRRMRTGAGRIFTGKVYIYPAAYSLWMIAEVGIAAVAVVTSVWLVGHTAASIARAKAS